MSMYTLVPNLPLRVFAWITPDRDRRSAMHLCTGALAQPAGPNYTAEHARRGAFHPEVPARRGGQGHGGQQKGARHDQIEC